MALKNETQKQEGDNKRYLFQRCPSCGVKLHINAVICWKCGKRHDYNANTGRFVNEVVFGSTNPNDEIYDIKVCDVDKCFDCRNTQNGKTCEFASCFGSGEGNCDYCNKFLNIRFMCCQGFQKWDEEAYRTLIYQSTQPFEKQQRKTA